MNMNFIFNNPTNLIFGKSSLNELGNLPMPGKKARVLISNGKSTRESGCLDHTLEQLEKTGVETALFDKIMENPIKDVIMEGASFAREKQCDFIVVLGGGAVIDSSAAIAEVASINVKPVNPISFPEIPIHRLPVLPYIFCFISSIVSAFRHRVLPYIHIYYNRLGNSTKRDMVPLLILSSFPYKFRI